VVIAPLHADRATPRRLQAPERVDDVTFGLDHLRRVAPAAVDRRAIGVAGHSFGGRTAVELAAQERRVRAVVTMAGGADRATTATVTAPTLMLAGSADTVDPPELSARSARALPPGTPPRVLVVPDVGHSGLRDAPASVRAASAWFLTYLGGQPHP
jgi:pimeloyl-ACP methyl ester carboxylesterase